MWLDKYEPWYLESYQTQHYVPLTAEFNLRTKQNFSCTTVRNRLQSYRTRINRKKLTRGPILDLTSPVKTIKKEKELPDKPYRCKELKESWVLGTADNIIIKQEKNQDKISKGIWEELEEKENFGQSGFLDCDTEEEESITAFLPDIGKLDPPFSFPDNGSAIEYRNSLMDFYTKKDAEKNLRVTNSMRVQPDTSRSTKTNLDLVISFLHSFL
jgi:hypothetical protein